jgi:molybdopterin synthase catalytic subunit
MIEVTEKEIRLGALLDRLTLSGSGSVVAHYGVVKAEAEGRQSRGVRLTRAGDLEGALAEVEAAVRSGWEVTDVAIARRLGELGVGQVILAVAVSAPGREAAFAACAAAVTMLKQRQGVSKEELFFRGPGS